MEHDHIEFEVQPVDRQVVKEVVLAGLHRVAEAVRFAVSLPREFASHGNHDFEPRVVQSPNGIAEFYMPATDSAEAPQTTV